MSHIIRAGSDASVDAAKEYDLSKEEDRDALMLFMEECMSYIDDLMPGDCILVECVRKDEGDWA